MKLMTVCALMVGAANAAPIQFQSSEHQTALVELYTSEGCSSCPPAEAWLTKLKSEPGLWSDFVPVAFHVDYWNRLGWRDKLSDAQYSARQQDYAQLWSAENIYTPEFVLNGREWKNWFGRRATPSASSTKPGVLRVQSNDGKHWSVSFAPTEGGANNYDVTAALLVSELGSDVKSGENAGRHLEHDFAALSLMTHSLASQTNGIEGGFIIDPSPRGISGRLALAVWVTRAGRLESLQATGGWLPTAAEPAANNASAKVANP